MISGFTPPVPSFGQDSTEGVFSVSELTQSVKFVLEEEFSSIRVAGEISNYRVPSSGHAYFVLRDVSSQIKCVLFRGQKRFLKFEPEDGMEVILSGSLGVYAPRGEYQIIASSIEPVGAGALQIAFEQLKAKLAKEGLFDQSIKKELPEFPEKIGVVTSRTGAAIRDIINVLTRRFPGVSIVIYPVRVQGDGAGTEIAEAIGVLNSIPNIDVMIVGRGGGSAEDLWAFNEEVVARAIYRSGIPVISAVGHETDYTVADFTADLRAPTPSAAAELVVRDAGELKKSVSQMRERLSFLMRSRISHLKEVVYLYSNKRVLKDPFAGVYDLLQRVDEYHVRLNRAAAVLGRRYKDRIIYLARRLKTLAPVNYIGQYRKVLIELEKRLKIAAVNDQRLRRKRLLELSGMLSSLSPLATMERGYSICFSLPEKRVIIDAGLVERGDKVLVRFRSGEMTCTVLDKSSILSDNLKNPEF